MIWDSSYWKKPLLLTARRLHFLALSETINQKQIVQIERDIFIGFYSIRKLLEARMKITNTTRTANISVSWYKNLKPVVWFNNHKINAYYELDKRQKEVRQIEFVSNQIIHSFIFMPYENNIGGLGGIFFTSDRDKNKKLYQLEIDVIVEIFERVGKDHVVKVQWKRGSGTENEVFRVD